MNKQYRKKEFLIKSLLIIDAVAITALGILFKMNFLLILPLYISMFISYFQSSVSRIAPLIGGCNSVLYAIVYFSFGDYGQAAYALLFSCPLQLVTFFNWRKNSYGASVKLKKLNKKQFLLVGIAFAILWIVAYFVLKTANSNSPVLDNSISLIGLLASFLMLFAYMEYIPLQVLAQVLTIALYSSRLSKNREQSAYLAYSVYALICCLMAFVRSRKQYRLQQEDEESVTVLNKG